jgi:hypothetical protein
MKLSVRAASFIAVLLCSAGTTDLFAGGLLVHHTFSSGAEPVTTASLSITANNSIVICVGGGDGETYTVNDSQSTSYSQAAARADNTPRGAQCFYGVAASTTSYTFTCHAQFGDAVRCYVAEFSGTVTSGLLDGHNESTGTGTVLTGGSFTSSSQCIVIGLGVTGSIVGVSAGSGFTLIDSDLISGFVYKVDSPAGSQNPEIDSDTNTTWVMAGFAIKESGSTANVGSMLAMFQVLVLCVTAFLFSMSALPARIDDVHVAPTNHGIYITK